MDKRLSHSEKCHIDFCEWLEERARKAENDGRLESARTIRETLSSERRRFRHPLTRVVNGISDAFRIAFHG